MAPFTIPTTFTFLYVASRHSMRWQCANGEKPSLFGDGFTPFECDEVNVQREIKGNKGVLERPWFAHVHKTFHIIVSFSFDMIKTVQKNITVTAL